MKEKCEQTKAAPEPYNGYRQDKCYRELAFEELLAIASDKNRPDSVCILAARTVLEMLR